jgi:hypothetical protein
VTSTVGMNPNPLQAPPIGLLPIKTIEALTRVRTNQKSPAEATPSSI